MFANKAMEANIGNNVLTAIPSKWERNPRPSAEAKEPNAGKQAVQLNAANHTPPEPILSAILLIIIELLL